MLSRWLSRAVDWEWNNMRYDILKDIVKHVLEHTLRSIRKTCGGIDVNSGHVEQRLVSWIEHFATSEHKLTQEVLTAFEKVVMRETLWCALEVVLEQHAFSYVGKRKGNRPTNAAKCRAEFLDTRCNEILETLNGFASKLQQYPTEAHCISCEWRNLVYSLKVDLERFEQQIGKPKVLGFLSDEQVTKLVTLVGPDEAKKMMGLLVDTAISTAEAGRKRAISTAEAAHGSKRAKSDPEEIDYA